MFPKPLRPGDTVAALSLSSGYASEVLHRYQAARRHLKAAFGWEVVAAPNALRGSEYLYRNPQARADDLHWALQHSQIAGMISCIGGDDSVRLLPYLRPDLIAAHPKVMLGFSDTTVTLLQFLRAGVGAFYGPALLTDLAENGGLHPYVVQGLRQALTSQAAFALTPAPEWTEQHLDWHDPALQEVPRRFGPSDGWACWQGGVTAEGHLIGGCLEVLDMLNGTPGWPEAELWNGAVIALETSEDVPPPPQVGYWLRNFAAQGIWQRAAALLLARPRGYTPEMVQALRGWVQRALWEAGREDLPVIFNLDFGHTSPQLTLPLGARLRVEPLAGTVEVLGRHTSP